jgi:hypothetical protein
VEKKTYGLTLEVAQKHLEEWMEAELQVTTNQSYTLENRSLTRANLREIGQRISYWANKVEELKAQEENGGRSRIYRALPTDW